MHCLETTPLAVYPAGGRVLGVTQTIESAFGTFFDVRAKEGIELLSFTVRADNPCLYACEGSGQGKETQEGQWRRLGLQQQPGSGDEAYTLRSVVVLDEPLRVEAGQTVGLLLFSADQPPGGHSSAVVFGTRAPGDESRGPLLGRRRGFDAFGDGPGTVTASVDCENDDLCLCRGACVRVNVPFTEEEPGDYARSPRFVPTGAVGYRRVLTCVPAAEAPIEMPVVAAAAAAPPLPAAGAGAAAADTPHVAGGQCRGSSSDDEAEADAEQAFS